MYIEMESLRDPQTMTSSHKCSDLLRICIVPILLVSFNLATLQRALAQSSLDCDQVVFDTAQIMQTRYELNVLQPSARRVELGGTPYPGSLSRTFLMRTIFSGPGSDNPYTRRTTMKARDFMSSPRVQRELATKVFDACRDTSIVYFGFANSGYFVPFFRMPSGVVREGIGLDCERGQSAEPTWGYYCSD